MSTQKLPWRPHTEEPTEPTTALIVTDMGDDTFQLFCLVGSLYTWQWGRWVEEKTGEPLDPDTPFFWLTEADLMKTIAPVQH